MFVCVCVCVCASECRREKWNDKMYFCNNLELCTNGTPSFHSFLTHKQQQSNNGGWVECKSIWSRFVFIILFFMEKILLLSEMDLRKLCLLIALLREFFHDCIEFHFALKMFSISGLLHALSFEIFSCIGWCSMYEYTTAFIQTCNCWFVASFLKKFYCKVCPAFLDSKRL
jgi:hypothetical protein